MKIIIETIPVSEMRYPSAGDYWWDENGTLQIKVAETGNEDFNKLIAQHELWEAWLCRHRGIKESDITDFDVQFEQKRNLGNKDEPGDSSLAPYKKEHCSATGVERMLAADLDVDWEKYEDVCNAL
jgi:hypothetical protein